MDFSKFIDRLGRFLQNIKSNNSNTVSTTNPNSNNISDSGNNQLASDVGGQAALMSGQVETLPPPLPPRGGVNISNYNHPSQQQASTSTVSHQFSHSHSTVSHNVPSPLSINNNNNSNIHHPSQQHHHGTHSKPLPPVPISSQLSVSSMANTTVPTPSSTSSVGGDSNNVANVSSPCSSTSSPSSRPPLSSSSLVASFNVPKSPASSASTNIGSISGGDNSFPIETPDSPIGFPRRQHSLNVMTRSNANSRLQLDLRGHKNSSSYAKTSASTDLIDKHSLSPRPRPKNLGISSSHDNIQKQPLISGPNLSFNMSNKNFAGDNFFSNPVGSNTANSNNISSRNQRAFGFGGHQTPNSSGHHHHHHHQYSHGNNFYISNNIRLKDQFSRTNYTININGKIYEHVSQKDFKKISELGAGSFGNVEKMLHIPSNTELAVKKMRRSGNQDDDKHILNDLDLLTKCNYNNIVCCYGYYILDIDVWIFMELMTICFDRLLKRLREPIPEEIIGKLAVSTISTLNYLKMNQNVIHRDIKPSNILINRNGDIKLCDFGISGRLIDSKAHSRSVGCTAYMAPERIQPSDPTGTYDIRSDVWSLGITLVEIATGKFPYQGWKSDFEILSKVILEKPPSLPNDGSFSENFCDFIKVCLTKDYNDRPKYNGLMKHPFFQLYQNKEVNVAEWFNKAYPENNDLVTDTAYSSTSSLASNSTTK